MDILGNTFLPFHCLAYFMVKLCLYGVLKDTFNFIEDQELKTVASKFIILLK